MHRFATVIALFVFALSAVGKAPLPKPLVEGLKNPFGICIGSDGRIYVSTEGELAKDGDGTIMVLKDGKAVPFATDLDDPKGLVAYQNSLFVADTHRIWRIGPDGNAKEFVSAKAFPLDQVIPVLKYLTVDPESGLLYV